MEATTNAPTTAEQLRYVFVERPRCPVCESSDLQTTRTERSGDDSLTHRKTCRNCGHKFFCVWT